MQKRVALYLRVSTTEQTLENQLRVSTTEQTLETQQRELAAVAEWHGWNVVAVCMPKVSIYTSISKVSTSRHLPERRCFRRWAFFPSSSAP
jgi:DNA invertase Pin-like site-specific DNA recombinase